MGTEDDWLNVKLQTDMLNNVTMHNSQELVVT